MTNALATKPRVALAFAIAVVGNNYRELHSELHIQLHSQLH